MSVLEELKEEIRVKLEKQKEHRDRHINKYGLAPCDYLTHQRDMVNYYRGGV